jgi:cysteinyl-tRNA synthetase
MLRLYNSLLGNNIAVAPLSPPEFKMYVCGPTVYDFPHIGHGRSVLTFDILRRYLEHKGFEVNHVSNVTDVDDKIIERARRGSQHPIALARKYEEIWWAEMDRLNVLKPKSAPRATDWIEQIVDMVATLVGSGVAYISDDGVYMDVSQVEDYGLLAQQDLSKVQSSERNASEHKRQSLDFALWKFAKADELTWSSPFGDGRPGWHSECVVMSTGILGHDFDLHGGGLDLRFPHHENERAQAEALGYGFAQIWMHHGFVESQGVKMSKSLGNFTTLTEMLDLYDPRAYRLLVVRAHYRSPLEVTRELAEEATSALRRLDQFAQRMGPILDDPTVELDESGSFLSRFEDAMDNDLDTPAATREIFEAVKSGNAAFDRGDFRTAKTLASQVAMAMKVLGLQPGRVEESIPNEIAKLATLRMEAKRSRDFAAADALRDQIHAAGYLVEDTLEGYRVRKS